MSPSRNWTEGIYVDIPEVSSPELLRSMAKNVASVSYGPDDCAFLLDVLGIDIKEVWP